MTRSLLVAVLASLTVALAPSPGRAETEDHRHSVVDLIVTHQDYSPFLPWQKRSPGRRVGHGAAVGPDLILTTEDLVRRGTLVEVRKSESGDKVTAEVIQADEHVNLALLRILPGPSRARFGALKPLAISEAKPTEAEFEILQFDDIDEIQSGDAEFLKASYSQLPGAPHAELMLQMIADLRVTRRSALVLENDKLAGIVAAYDSGSRAAFVLPADLLRRFTRDALNAPYVGFAVAGFSWSPLVDPVKRAWLKVPDTDTGVLVNSLRPGSGVASVLEVNDVIVSWDSYPVSRQGFFDDELFGRMRFARLIKGRKAPGDTAEIGIFRNGEAMTVRASLTRSGAGDLLIPENTVGDPVPYIVEAGLVIRELTGDYLRAHGADWASRVDARLANLYHTQSAGEREAGERVVLLSTVLPDPINVGYQHFRNRVIEAVNGEAVSDLDDVFDILMQDGVLRRIKLAHLDVELVVDADQVGGANARLAASYRIPQLRRRMQ